MPKEKKPKKVGRPCPFTEERYEQHIQAHCELLEAIHQYYLEFEDWDRLRSFNTSKRQYYCLMRMMKQVKIRLLQIKQFQNSRQPKFDPNIYKEAYQKRLQRENAALQQELEETVQNLKKDLGLSDD